MNYYFANNKIYAFEWELDLMANPAYTPLTKAQAQFYESNPDASIYEVKNCKLNEQYIEPEPTLEELKAAAIKQLSELSLATLDKFVKAYQVANAQSSLFAISKGDLPIYAKAQAEKVLSDYNTHGLNLRSLYLDAELRIKEAETEYAVNLLLNTYIDKFNDYGASNED